MEYSVYITKLSRKVSEIIDSVSVLPNLIPSIIFVRPCWFEDLFKVFHLCCYKIFSNMVKDTIRSYDEQGFKRRAACICVRSEDEAEILLISSKCKLGKWKVPGGGVDPGEESDAAAVREVSEEAGVTGKLGRSLGVFEDPDARDRTEVYVMVVTEELKEWDESRSMGRKRQWFPINEALEQVALYKPLQRNYLQELCLSKVTNESI